MYSLSSPSMKTSPKAARTTPAPQPHAGGGAEKDGEGSTIEDEAAIYVRIRNLRGTMVIGELLNGGRNHSSFWFGTTCSANRERQFNYFLASDTLRKLSNADHSLSFVYCKSVRFTFVRRKSTEREFKTFAGHCFHLSI